MPSKEFKRVQNQLQWWGVSFGLLIAWTLGILFPGLPARISWVSLMIWGAAIGAALFSWRSFEHAGRVVTRSENRWLNFVIGFSIPVVFLALLTVLLRR